MWECIIDASSNWVKDNRPEKQEKTVIGEEDVTTGPTEKRHLLSGNSEQASRLSDFIIMGKCASIACR